MLSINQVVLNKKGDKGTITKIITKSTGYVEVSYENGTSKKEMAFNLTDENGISLKKAPKSAYMSKGEKKRHKDAAALAAFDALPYQDQLINKLQWINNCVYGDRFSVQYRLLEDMFLTIETKAKEVNNDFIVSLCNSAIKYMKCSDKQAYCIARFVIENKINIII